MVKFIMNIVNGELEVHTQRKITNTRFDRVISTNDGTWNYIILCVTYDWVAKIHHYNKGALPP